jgi:hypothetical protein
MAAMTPSEPTDTAEHVVHESFGPPLAPSQAAAALALGVISLLMAGLLPTMLGALADEHRLSAAGIGQCATFEALSMAGFTALAGIVLKPQRLRLIGALASLALAGLEVATMGASGNGVLIVRTAAGLPEGILLWIAIGMIARTQTPERWSAVFLTAITLAQFVMALIFALGIIARYGVDGAFAGLALATLPGIAIAFWVPNRYVPLPKPEGESGAPPLRGWMALGATLVYAAAAVAVNVYLQPLAHEAGLNADVARTAVWVSLAAQVLGGSLATVLAGRVRYLPVFLFASLGFLLSWLIFGLHVPAWLFVFSNGLNGLVYLLVTPFLVPMTIEADPSRRAAVLSASVQVLAGALGPLLASFVVDDRNVHGSLYLGTGLLLAGLVMIGGLHFAAVRDRAKFADAAFPPD